jgi:hypothetical protein
LKGMQDLSHFSLIRYLPVCLVASKLDCRMLAVWGPVSHYRPVPWLTIETEALFMK